MLRCGYRCLVQFGKAVNEIVTWRGQTEVLGQIDDLHLLGNGVFL